MGREDRRESKVVFSGEERETRADFEEGSRREVIRWYLKVEKPIILSRIRSVTIIIVIQ